MGYIEGLSYEDHRTSVADGKMCGILAYADTVMAMDAVLNSAKAIKEDLGAEKFLDPTTFCARARMADESSAMNAGVEWCDRIGEDTR